MARSFEQDLATLGLSKQQLDTALNAIPEGPSVWAQRTKTYHDLIKKARKEKQREVHPDLSENPNTETLSKEVNEAADALLTLSVVPQAPPPVHIIFHQANFRGSATNTSTTTISGNPFVNVSWWSF